MGLITPCYMTQQRLLHAAGDYGVSSGRWAPQIKQVFDKEECKSLLDYGCGQGQLKQSLGDIVTEYDPCIDGKNSDPAPADMVVCTDVLEHIEPECLNDVLHHLHSKVRKRLFVVIHLLPAQKTLADGRNAHLLVEPPEWWRERFAKLFRILQWTVLEDRELVALLQPLNALPQIKSIGAVADDVRNANTAKNVLVTDQRIPEVPLPPNEKTIVLVCYGPSLKDTYKQIPYKKFSPDFDIVSVSGSHDFLRERGIIPDIHVECDPRPHKAGMLRQPHRYTKYLMASCCDPGLISDLAGYDLVLWHLFNGDESFKIRELPGEESCALIPGGGSVGLRCFPLFYFLGYRKFIVHGMDCSFADTQHAGHHTGKVQQEINVNPRVSMPDGSVLRSDRWFKTSPVLVSYANHLMRDLRNGRFPNTSIELLGNGLLKEMMRMEALQVEALGIAPVKGRDYFSLREDDLQPTKESAA
jgi:hypothetical protein